MKAQVNRRPATEIEAVEVQRVEIWIGEIQYTFKQTIDGHLEINKYNPDDSSAISVFPMVTNQIEIL